MLLRRIGNRTSLAIASRHFSAEASVAVAASAPEKSAVKAVTSVAKATNGSGGRDTLGRRLLSLIYPKRSAVITIKKWKEEGHPVRKYELNRIVRELRKFKRYKHALEICEWMTLQKDMKLQPGDYAVHLDLIAKVRGLNSAEKFFEDLPDTMMGQPTCTALLHTYVQNNSPDKAEALMDKMSECGFLNNPLPYNHMLSLYVSNKQLEKVPELIRELKKNSKPDLITYNLLLTVSASQNLVESAEKVLLEMRKAKINLDWVSYSTLTNLYLKNSLPDKAAANLKEMEKTASKDKRASYSSLLSLNTNMGDRDGVHRIWQKMKKIFRKMSDTEYTCMISSLVKLKEFEEAETLYTEWETVSGTGDPRVPNILLAAYINKNQIESVEKFYNRMVSKGISPCYTTWELLTWAFLKEKEVEKVVEYFTKAIGSVTKWNPDEKLIRQVFKEVKEQGNVETAEKLLVVLRNAHHVNTEVYNLLLGTYAKAGKMALVVEERMEKDGVELNEETRELIKLTKKMCVSEVSSTFS